MIRVCLNAIKIKKKYQQIDSKVWHFISSQMHMRFGNDNINNVISKIFLKRKENLVFISFGVGERNKRSLQKYEQSCCMEGAQ